MRTASLAVGFVLALAASCQRREQPISTEAPQASDAEAPDALALEPPPPAPTLDAGPAGAQAPRDERERAVWALVTGEISPSRLPEVGTDDGKKLDLALRDRLAPGAPGLVGLGQLPTGTVEIGSAVVTGEIDDAQRVIAGLRAGLRACYQRSLAEHPDVSGTIHLTVFVAADGTVKNVESRGAGGFPPELTSCIKARVTSAVFAAKTAAKLVFPLKLAQTR